ncbi:MAG TPA: MarR family transcriptional regulator [Microlunatus sp.]|nr:MarR family transcriptional regulator [Microlunatus sp.]
MTDAQRAPRGAARTVAPDDVTRSGRRSAGRTDGVETLLTAARVFAAITAESIARAGAGITLPQLRVLVLASERQPLSAGAVADALDVHASSASRICDRLVQAGLLHRRDRPEDRRQLELTLTESGVELLAAVTEHRREVFQRILGRLEINDRAALTDALERFIGAAVEYDVRRTMVP